MSAALKGYFAVIVYCPGCGHKRKGFWDREAWKAGRHRNTSCHRCQHKPVKVKRVL